MGFDLEGYGIHGTNEPDKLGQQITLGCVRMSNEEVEELFSIVPTSTEVTILD
jgi:lipoprotein-anchoring transpeptidase ErfK/SrfK